MSNNTEERYPLIPIGVDMKCGECDDGYLEVVDSNGQVAYSNNLLTYPPPKPTYLHVCTNDLCGNRAYFENVYPGIEYAPLEDFIDQ